MKIILIARAVLFYFTALMTLYSLLFAVAGLWGSKKQYRGLTATKRRKMAVFIPAYREDAVIYDSAQRALEQDYPQDRYDVIVVADSLRAETLKKLATLPVIVIEVSFEVSTKAKALNAAMAQLPADYEAAVVLDADNVLEKNFLTLFNAAFDQGWKAVQGHRIAKNTNNSIAILDAISEEINNHILRKGHQALSMSANLIGSGMAFDYPLFRNTMSEINTTGGFDKELDMRLTKQRIRVEYVEEALCYDEKVQDPAVFEKQRTRWIAAQMKYLRKDLLSGVVALFKGNIDYFDKAFQTLLLPRVMLLGFQTGGVVLGLLSGNRHLILLTVIQLVVLLFVFYISTPSHLKKMLSMKEIAQLPGLFLRFLRALTKMGEARKKYINTPHDVTGNL